MLRSVWDEPRPPHPPARGWRDWALVGVVVAGALTEVAVRQGLAWSWLSAATAIGLAPTLLWRRARPLLMAAIAFGTCAAISLAIGRDPDFNSLAFVLLLVYSLFRWGSGREFLLGSLIVAAKVGLSLVMGELTLPDAIGGLVVLSATSAIGAALRYRTRSRLREIDQVTLLERARIARDLHDTVAHHVSAIAIRAQAGLAVAPGRPEAATEALRVIEAEASRTLAEMRAMVRALRGDVPAQRSPGPRVEDLRQLAAAPGGPPVDIELIGDLADLPVPVGAAIYRLAQEALTNARRHARHATRIAVRVAADDAEVRLRVTDDGDAGTSRSTAPGYGLLGMTERAGLLGGTCEAGPNPDRGWTVTAVLPRAVAA
ncbi:histidine kinase [Luedemannella flava]|uniref:histidine kinase n=1 Tax=Luedemannella flava TaxID=349316 RepID=A0ABN2LNS1_9ACTN